MPEGDVTVSATWRALERTILPSELTEIGAEAFAGSAVERVEVGENVTAIGFRAFADCTALREIVIPASVTAINRHALEGCADVTVYGAAGSEAERFAVAAGWTFVDPDAA